MKTVYQFKEPDCDTLYSSLNKAYDSAKETGLEMPFFGTVKYSLENDGCWIYKDSDYMIIKRRVI